MRHYAIICLVCIHFASFCQKNEVIDSLHHLLSITKNKTEQSKILNDLHKNTYRNDPQLSLEYAKKAFSLSGKDQCSEPYIRACQNMGISFSYLNNTDSSLYYFYKALETAKLCGNNVAEASSIRSIGSVFWYKNEFDSAISFYTLALEKFQAIGDEQQIATCISNLGVAHYSMGNYKEAIDYYMQSFNMLDTIKNPIEAASTLNDIGVIYQEWGNPDKALVYFLWALRKNEEQNNPRGIATNLDNIGQIYFAQKNYPQALQYAKQGLNIDRQIENYMGQGYSCLSIGKIYEVLQAPDSALYYYTLSKKLFFKTDDKAGLSEVFQMIGDHYKTIELYTDAIEAYKTAIIYADSINDKQSAANAYSGMGISQFFNDKLLLAERNLLYSTNIAQNQNYIHILLDNYYYLSKVYQKLGNKDKQIEYLQAFISTKDSIYNIEKQKQITELQAKYETDKKEKEIELLNRNESINKSRLRFQRTIIYGILIILLLLLLAIFLLFKRNKEKQLVNTLLNSKNREIEKQKAEIEKQNVKLARQAQKLQELDELKSNFFTNISHEFRTPLTLIIGPVEKLLERVKDKDQQDQLKIILHNARQLLDLINQLLEISSIEKGTAKLYFQKTNIKKEIQFLINMFSSYAAEKSLTLNFNAEENNYLGYLDKGKFSRIIGNILSNSIKYTSEGSIDIHLRQIDHQQVQITISDTGIGIDEESLPYIFERFYRTDQSKLKHQGTGIGLAYTKELINLYKGNINVTSSPGKGTIFTLTLPLSIAGFNENEYEITEEAVTFETFSLQPVITPDFKNKTQKKHAETVLVVEDHHELRQFICNTLAEKYNILQADNGKSGIEKAEEYNPDIIITDLMMPEVNGIELTKTLKTNENTSHIPIIILTAKSTVKSKIEGLESAADDYLTKPFHMEELQARITNLLNLRKKLREKYHRSIEVVPSEVTSTSVDERFLSKLLSVVEENMADPEFSVDKLCSLVAVSRANLHKKLKALLDQSATEFINSIRLKRAAQLIKQKSGTISEIAYDVGFSNISYFTRTFKKYFNILPSQFMEE
ncbi:MAG: tetratricopeptide repeat protein [Bacteroidales bacterium]|nr:tetratricopeptide repeat protein [Bacteroidales bacterium]